MAKGKGFGGFGGRHEYAGDDEAGTEDAGEHAGRRRRSQMESTGTAGGGMVTATVTGTSTPDIAIAGRC